MDEQLKQKVYNEVAHAYSDGRLDGPDFDSPHRVAEHTDSIMPLLATEYDRGKVETIDKIIAETWGNPEFDFHSSSAWGDYLMKLKEGSKDE